MVRILVVEDDKNLNDIVCRTLESNGFETTGCLDALQAEDKLAAQKYSLILSDIMMPHKDGFEFAGDVRADDKDIPFLFMTAKDDIASKQRGFRLGIDDYIVKPFDLQELVMRVKAVLRRAGINASKRLCVGNLVMDEDERTACIGDKELPLTVREFDILFKLLSFPKKTFTRARLMEEFWDFDSSSSSRTVDVYMAKLRDKTKECDGFDIVTVHGLGYKAVLK